MQRLLLLLLTFVAGSVTLADRSCDWHKANDSFPNYAHYAQSHDRNKDGHGCEAQFPPGSHVVQPTAVPSVVQATSVPVSEQASVGLIQVAPENRCSPYDRDDYYYPQSIELRIINENLGGQITSPYTGESFSSRAETDIEHIVATSEAHDSGLCAATLATRNQFAQDLQNLTLASPELNRDEKRAKDLSEWLPPLNQCWYVSTVVAVKSKYGLTMDNAEASVARRLLAECDETDEQTSGGVETGGARVVSANPILHVELQYRSNLRARAGTEYAIVGVADPGSAFPYVTTGIGGDSEWWYQVRLPNGWGWIHSDLASLEWY